MLGRPIAVANDQELQGRAIAQQDKAFLVVRVVGVGNQPSPFVGEDGLGLVEADTMLLEIGLGFGLVPLEVKRRHGLNVNTL